VDPYNVVIGAVCLAAALVWLPPLRRRFWVSGGFEFDLFFVFWLVPWVVMIVLLGIVGIVEREPLALVVAAGMAFFLALPAVADYLGRRRRLPMEEIARRWRRSWAPLTIRLGAHRSAGAAARRSRTRAPLTSIGAPTMQDPDEQEWREMTAYERMEGFGFGVAATLAAVGAWYTWPSFRALGCVMLAAAFTYWANARRLPRWWR
jgi:hypothetical protein